MTRTVGITGLSGAVAGSLGAYLEKKDCTVLSLDTLTRVSGRPNQVPEGRRMDWVIHFGAHTSIEESWENPFKYYTENSMATLAALEIAHLGKANFIYISSDVYGVRQYTPIDEKHPVSASNPYMGSKLISEAICSEASGRLGIPLVIFRPFHIYGPRGKPGRLITDLLAQASKRETLLVKDPEPKRDYLYVEDFCELIWKALTQSAAPSGIYNLGSGVSHSNLEVAHMVRDLVDPDLGIDVQGCSRQGDVSDCTMDPQKAKMDFGWLPKHTLQEGLQRIVSGESRMT